MLSQAHNTFHHNPRLRGPVSSSILNDCKFHILAVCVILFTVKSICLDYKILKFQSSIFSGVVYSLFFVGLIVCVFVLVPYFVLWP